VCIAARTSESEIRQLGLAILASGDDVVNGEPGHLAFEGDVTVLTPPPGTGYHLLSEGIRNLAQG